MPSYAELGEQLPPPRDEVPQSVPMGPPSRVNLRYEPPNISSNATVSRVQSAIRSAEAGNTRDLFALYRDEILTGSHVLSEFSKRKMPVLSEPHSIQPIDPQNTDDVKAQEAIKWMIDNCDNWNAGLNHLLDSSLWPVAVDEKVFEPAAPGSGFQFRLKMLSPVNHTLLCFTPKEPSTLDPQLSTLPWEPELRFYQTTPGGDIEWVSQTALDADPLRHVIHRGHLLGSVKDNFGGPMRAVVFWWLLAILGRDWFARYMERYGSPWPVAKCDADDTAAVAFLKEALCLSTKIGGLVVDTDTEVELAEAMTANAADAYERFLNVCNREVSKVIVGHTLSGTADPTGLGSGTSDLQGEVREDYKRFDRKTLGETLRQQVFKQFLLINGIPGAAPRIVWGGLSMAEAKQQAEVLQTLGSAGLEPVDDALPTISEKVGFAVQRKAPPPAMPGGFGGMNAAQLTALSAGLPSFVAPASDKVAREKSAALARAFRNDLAPVLVILNASGSPDEFERNLANFFKGWKPAKVAAVAEEALQICAAAGAGEK